MSRISERYNVIVMGMQKTVISHPSCYDLKLDEMFYISDSMRCEYPEPDFMVIVQSRMHVWCHGCDKYLGYRDHNVETKGMNYLRDMDQDSFADIHTNVMHCGRCDVQTAYNVREIVRF